MFGSGKVSKTRVKSSNFSNRNVDSKVVRSKNSRRGVVSDEIICLNKEPTYMALVALTAGFPSDSLTDEEIEVGVDMFGDVIPERCSGLLDSAYNYLLSYVYINFGVALAIKNGILNEPSKGREIVIGPGLAGLATARQLMLFGFEVTVLEGQKRAGRRVYTKKMERGNKVATADLGGSVLTGTLGNPLGLLGRQLLYTLHKQEVRQELSQVVSLGEELETLQKDFDVAMDAKEMILFNWHLANLEYANTGLLSQLSLAFLDQDDPYDMGGDHCFLSGGNGRLVHALAENVPIIFLKNCACHSLW
ncbi:hypothetical protein KY290_025474 [Solanum tuberosum]|uniref:Amine oxidase domain-containing protein n=1 Tax=Solanum tuberosum TaxID=4113 RepID=A0ABQ7UTN8_SOLTU|nr:hypothetical protein KY290_025474 [Solanum tuberosum]